MSEVKPQLLIVEDDLGLAEMLNAYFREQGYEVLTAVWGVDAVRICQETPLDLVVLDIRLPDIDGYEVCRQIRSNRLTAHLPVIFLTEMRDRTDKLAGLELGVVDYITKPFDIQELRLRVRNTLNRAQQYLQINPVTNMMGETLTHDYLNELLYSDQKWAILSLRVAGLDYFRELYGFIAADEVLRAVTLMINNAVRDHTETEKTFIGHFTGQDFIIITETNRIQSIMESLTARLQHSLAYFYPLKDREELPNLSEDQRLHLVMGITKYGDEPFTDLDSLRKSILKAREQVNRFHP